MNNQAKPTSSPIIPAATAQNASSTSPNPLRMAAHGLKAYLTNWRNLLAHSLLGVALLVFAIWAPLPLWIRLTAIGALICFNVWRMRRSKRQKAIATIVQAKDEMP